MATLDTLVYQFNRELLLVVKINGVNLQPVTSSALTDTGVPGVSSIRTSKALDSPVPVCDIELSHLATWIRRGHSVTVDMGYVGAPAQRVFTGYVQSRERKVAGATLRCLGKSYSLFRTIQIGDVNVSGKTVKNAIKDILTDVGITDRNVNVGSFTLNTSGQDSMKLERMPASQMVQMLADIDGSRTYETNMGTVVIGPLEEVPAPTAAYTYTTSTQATAIVLNGSDREDPDYFRNQVIVTGATLQSDGDTEAVTLSATAQLVDAGSLIQPPMPSGTYIGTEYSNQLIDTQAQCDALALVLLSRFARIPRYLTLEIAGDPRVDIGMTISLEFTHMGISSSRWFVHGISHSVDNSGGYRTTLQLRGGDLLGGTLTLAPVATFSAMSEVENMGGRMLTVIYLDATASYDPDGTITDPTGYVWTANQPITMGTGKRLTVNADTTGWVGDLEITLTLTDDDGATATSVQVVPYGGAADVIIPALYAAINNNATATLDGGQTWNNQSGSTCISVGARPADGVNIGHACFGYSNGVIKRTTDGCASALTTVYTLASGAAINDIQWDWRNGNVVWAISEDAQVLISLDAGVTWSVYSALRSITYVSGTATAAALGNSIGLPGAGGVYVFGGTGGGYPLIAYDPVVGSKEWVHVAFTGEIAEDMPADATMRIVDYAAEGSGLEAMILSWSSGGGLPIIFVQGRTRDLIASASIGGTTWSSVRDSGTEDFSGLRHYGGYLFRIELTADANGQLQRSSDNGITWEDIGPTPFLGSEGDWWGCRDFDFAIDGKMYALYGVANGLSDNDDDSGTDVYRVSQPTIGSPPSFVLIHEDNERTFSSDLNVPIAVSCHPDNADWLVIQLDAASGNDRFTTCENLNDVSPTFTKITGDANNMGPVRILSSGRYVAANSSSIEYSDDKGATFSTAQAMGNSSTLNISRANGAGPIFVKVGSGGFALEIWRSTDGATWTRIITGTTDNPTSMVYDSVNDALYLATGSTGAADRIGRIDNASTLGADAGALTDITGNLDSLTNWGSVDIGDGGIAIAASTGVTAVYYTNAAISPPGASRAFWRATTTFGGLKTGRFMVGDTTQFHCAFANRSVWHSTDGATWTETTNVFPANTVPWHAIWLGRNQGPLGGAIFAAALEDTVTPNNGYLVKSVDGFVTAPIMRPTTGSVAVTWPASAKGKKIAIGAAASTPSGGQILIVGEDDDDIAVMDGQLSSSWSVRRNTGTTEHYMQLRYGAGALWRIQIQGICPECTDAVGTLERSLDRGATWAAVGPSHYLDTDPFDEWVGVKRYDFAANGWLWVLITPFSNNETSKPQLYRVQNPLDANPTFELMYTEEHTGIFGDFLRGVTVTCHPTNPNVVLFQADYSNTDMHFIHTTNATAGVPTFSCTGDVAAANTLDSVTMLGNGVIFGYRSSTIRYSEDYGATWPTGQDQDIGGNVAITYGALRHYTQRDRSVAGAFRGFLRTFTGPGSEMWMTVDGGKKWRRVWITTASLGSSVWQDVYDNVRDVLWMAAESYGAWSISGIAALGRDEGVAVAQTHNLDALAWGSQDWGGIAVIP